MKIKLLLTPFAIAFFASLSFSTIAVAIDDERVGELDARMITDGVSLDPIAEMAETELPEAELPEAEEDTYPLKNCPVSNDELGAMGEVVIHHYTYTEGEGEEAKEITREIRFCCKSCIPKFEADPKAVLSMLDEAIAKQSAAGEHGEAEMEESEADEGAEMEASETEVEHEDEHQH